MTNLDQTNSSKSFQDNRIDMKELLGFLWEGRKIIIIITTVSYLSAFFYGRSLNDYYESSATLSVIEAVSGGNSLGGAAALAGISITQVGVKGPRFLNTIRSRSFLNHLITKYDHILPALMAAESYDVESKKLVFNSDIYDAANKKWLTPKPNYLQAYPKYVGLLYNDYHDVRRIIDLSVTHLSPIFAKEFADIIIKEGDLMLRQFDMQVSNDSLEYLNTEISSTNLLNIRSSINQMILSQMQTKMMTQIGNNYVVIEIDPPYIPLRPNSPSRSFINMVGLLGGFVVGVLLVLGRQYVGFNITKQKSGL